MATNTIKQNILLSLVRIIGLLFLISGIGKVLTIKDFEELIQNYNIIRNELLVSFTASLICFIEIIIGFELVLLYKIKRNLSISLIIIILFTLIFAYGNIFNNIKECGCFGRFSFENHSSPLLYFIKNIFFISTIFFTIKNVKINSLPVDNPIVKYFSVILAFTIGLFSSINLHAIDNSAKKQTNINFKELTKHLSLSQDSTYFVFIFTYTCPHCINSIENVKRYSDSPYIDKTIFLTYNSHSKERKSFKKQFGLNDTIIEIAKNELSAITTQFPTGFYIKNNNINFSIKGLMPAKLFIENKILSN